MSPQTRSMALSAPRRKTRNSICGRPFVLPPSKLRKALIKSQSESAPAYDSQAEGTHEYPSNDDDDAKADEEDAAEVEMLVDEVHDMDVRPWDAHSTFMVPTTPIAFDRCKAAAGSVALTPVKDLKPLQPSPAFIDVGDITGVQDGVPQAEPRYPRFAPEALAHLIGSTNALSKGIDMMRAREEAFVLLRPSHTDPNVARPIRLGPCGTEIYN